VIECVFLRWKFVRPYVEHARGNPLGLAFAEPPAEFSVLRLGIDVARPDRLLPFGEFTAQGTHASLRAGTLTLGLLLPSALAFKEVSESPEGRDARNNGQNHYRANLRIRTQRVKHQEDDGAHRRSGEHEEAEHVCLRIKPPRLS
jgi:hypothetical protein